MTTYPRCCTHYPTNPEQPHGPHHVCRNQRHHHGTHECICGHTWTTAKEPAHA